MYVHLHQTCIDQVGNIRYLYSVSSVRETVIDVEFPLITERLSAIDEKLEKAIATLNWTSDGIQHMRSFIRCTEVVCINF